MEGEGGVGEDESDGEGRDGSRRSGGGGRARRGGRLTILEDAKDDARRDVGAAAGKECVSFSPAPWYLCLPRRLDCGQATPGRPGKNSRRIARQHHPELLLAARIHADASTFRRVQERVGIVHLVDGVGEGVLRGLFKYVGESVHRGGPAPYARSIYELVKRMLGLNRLTFP